MQCTALYITNKELCKEQATSLNGLFCNYHSRQCQGLYKGYKRRNARLDTLNKSAPTYLSQHTVPLANQTFADTDSEILLDEVQQHLYDKYTTLERIIRARKVHHAHFFSLSLDYGHQHYLDVLQNQRFIVQRALERLIRRTAEVLYAKQKWFKWVRECQDEEEDHRENESKRIKREAVLFKRHWKEMELRTKALREIEERQRQEEYLDEAYNQTLSEKDEGDDLLWDPIEDAVDYDRGNFVELIKHFLWQDGASLPPRTDLSNTKVTDTNGSSIPQGNAAKDEALGSSTVGKDSKSAKKKSNAKNANTKTDEVPIDISETKMDMRRRLKQGSDYRHEYGPASLIVRGTIEDPVGFEKTLPLPDDEIDQLLEEISEIKCLLFCRLLLSHAALLPAAIRANSVDAFLNDQEVTIGNLRDLCLKMEKPDLQDIRDACADLGRGTEEAEDDDSETDDDLPVQYEDDRLAAPIRHASRGVPRSWRSEHEKKLQTMKKAQFSLPEDMQDNGKTFIDFGVIEDDGKYVPKKMRVKICGHSIYNYRSERAMTHAAWYHFSIIAKDSNLYDAIKLCRHWDEFFDLNILAIFRFFPAPNWLMWIGDRLRSQQLQLGFISYHTFVDADEVTVRHQTGSRGGGRRQHAIREARNFVCAHVKRNDASSRRFIQYLLMQTYRLFILVRDAKTGEVLSQPPQEDLWLVREKSGIGRAVKNEWTISKQVGPDLFQEIDDNRQWHFGFKEYYDLYLWDNEAGEDGSQLYCAIQNTLIKAHRFCKGADFYGLAAPVLKTLTQDTESPRVRKIKLGEDVQSIFDVINDERSEFRFPMTQENNQQPPHYILYNEADALEDRVLFPEEFLEEPVKENMFRESTNKLHKFEYDGPDMRKWITGYSSDESEYVEDHDHGEDNLTDEDETFDLSDLALVAPQSSPQKEKSVAHVHPQRHLTSRNLSDELTMAPGSVRNTEMEESFQHWMELEQSKAFKVSFHKADDESGSLERYIQTNQMVKKMARHGVKNKAWVSVCIELLERLGQTPEALTGPQEVQDMYRAYAMMSFFFPTDFFESQSGLEYKSHSFLDQTERCKKLPPDRRTHHSNKYMPRKIWSHWDSLPQGYSDDKYPLQWDVAIRPIVARLYKESIIAPSHLVCPTGYVVAGKEPGRELDLYFDWRKLTEHMNMPPTMQDPTRITPESLRTTAGAFAAANSMARFAILKLWSPSHFYPFMIGYDKRDDLSFIDCVGRTWEWKFMPKDMPYSEWSVHYNCRRRLEPFMHVFDKKVVVKRDVFLIMGTGEEDLKKMATAVTYAVQTRPWRLEIDLWRSFVNVDYTFLNKMDDKWLE